jgi:predicted S18 family serine protease
MAKLNGQTPEEIAAEIIEAAVTSVKVEISGTANQDLEKILRYANAKKIYVKGEKWFQSNIESLQTEWLEKVIKAQAKQREKLDEKEAEQEKLEYFKILISRGVDRTQAIEMAGLVSPAKE